MQQIHVSPDGADRGPGTLEQPFSTLRRAREAVRSLTGEVQEGVVVNLHTGIHILDAPLQLSNDAGDSGTADRPVVWQAVGEEPVVVSGGRRIGSWELDDPDTNVWRADVGGLDTRQLYVAGRRAMRARFEAGGAVGLPGEVTLTDEGYVTTSTAPQCWENPADLEFVYRGHGGFAEPRCGVAAIEAAGEATSIAMDQPGFRWFTQNHSGRWGEGPRGFGEEIVFKPPLPLWIENSRSFLTEPGTFYLDRSEPGRHVLFYLPRPDEQLDSAPVIAPVLEHLLDGHGVHDVVFRGLTFAYATWLGPSQPTGFSQVFGPIYEGGDTPDFEDPWDSSESARSIPGNVRFRGCERIAIERCRFVKLGADALEFSLGSSRCAVRGSVFSDVSGGGIQLGSRQPDTDADRINEQIVVENNHVDHVGVEYKGSIGIYAEKTQQAEIVHNQVNDVPYTGISFGEYWTHYATAGETTAYGNRILDNCILRTMQSLTDGGGIFTASHQGTSYEDGSVVSGNLIHHVESHADPNVGESGGLQPQDIGEDTAIALYADDDSNYVTWERNVVYAVEGTAISGCPLHNRFVDNFLEDTVEPGFWCVRGGPHVEFERNICLDSKNDPGRQVSEIPAAKEIAANAGLIHE